MTYAQPVDGHRVPRWLAALVLVVLGMVLVPVTSSLWHRIDRDPGRDGA